MVRGPAARTRPAQEKDDESSAGIVSTDFYFVKRCKRSAEISQRGHQSLSNRTSHLLNARWADCIPMQSAPYVYLPLLEDSSPFFDSSSLDSLDEDFDGDGKGLTKFITESMASVPHFDGSFRTCCAADSLELSDSLLLAI